MKNIIFISAFLFVSYITLAANVPNEIPFNIIVRTNNTLFFGDVFFKFAILGDDEELNFWANDNTTTNEPINAVSAIAEAGKCSLKIGDASLQNMAILSPEIFDNPEKLRLRVWLKAGEGEFELLAPDSDFSSVPYSLNSALLSGKSVDFFANSNQFAILKSDNSFLEAQIISISNSAANYTDAQIISATNSISETINSNISSNFLSLSDKIISATNSISETINSNISSNFLSLSDKITEVESDFATNLATETTARQSGDSLLKNEINTASNSVINFANQNFINKKGDYVTDRNFHLYAKGGTDNSITIGGMGGDDYDASVKIGTVKSNNGGGDVILMGGCNNEYEGPGAKLTISGASYIPALQGGIDADCSYFKINDKEVATKNYTDTKIISATNSISKIINSNISSNFLSLSDKIISATNAVSETINLNISSNFLSLSGGSLSGSLSAPNINLIPKTIEGYLVSGSSDYGANGFYADNGTTYYGLPVYENENGIIMYAAPYSTGYFTSITPGFGMPYYENMWDYNYPAVGSWYSRTTVSVHTKTIYPQIDFATGKAINLQNGINPQDAATINQLSNQLSNSLNYTDTQIISATNSISETINSNISSNFLPLTGGTLSGALTIKRQSTDDKFLQLRHNGLFSLIESRGINISNITSWIMLKSSDTNGNYSWLARFRLGEHYFYNNRLSGIGNPVSDSDAVTKKYVDDCIDNKISETENQIISVSNSAINYTDSQIDYMYNNVGSNYISKFGDTMNGNLTMKGQLIVNNNAIIQQNGKLGVGTTNPQGLIDVHGKIEIGGFAGYKTWTNENNELGIYFNSKGAANGNDQLHPAGRIHGDSIYPHYFSRQALILQAANNWSTYVPDQLVLLGNGNIGIGTNLPSAKLYVSGKIKSRQTTSGDSDNTVTTKGYIDNKQFTTENISDGAITITKLATNLINDIDDKYINADDTNGDTMYGPLTVKKLIIDKSYQPSFSFQKNGIAKGAIFYWEDGDDSIHIARYDDSGIYIDSPIKIKRQTGEVNIKNLLTVPELNINSDNHWIVGSVEHPNVNIVLAGENSLITSLANKDIVLDPAGSKKTIIKGDLQVNGTIDKIACNFKIDHPLDPENKVLRHTCIESPDMKNFYDGIVILDKNGEAIIKLPDYFEALNKSFRYSLTPIGLPMPSLHIKSEIRNLKFGIGGGIPGQKVSWQVTGIRHDKAALENPVIVEEEK